LLRCGIVSVLDSSIMHTTPVSLLERIRRSADQAAWERFVKLYTPLLGHWARRLGSHGPDADDLVQEVFAALVRKLPDFRYDAGKRFRGWLWTVLVNKVRAKHRHQSVCGPAGGDGILDQVAAPDEADAVSEAEYRQYLTRRALELMRAEFQPTTWRAFWECVVADRAGAEVAAELGLSVDAVYAAKSRVLRRLRRELAGLLD
jgi:RNA polymerase sigma-70 factor (ECF subfamily)